VADFFFDALHGLARFDRRRTGYAANPPLFRLQGIAQMRICLRKSLALHPHIVADRLSTEFTTCVRANVCSESRWLGT